MAAAAQAAVAIIESTPATVDPIIVKPSGPPIWAIQSIVEACFKVTHAELIGHQAYKRVIWARHVAIWLSYRMTSLSSGGVARHFGNRDHTTILTAARNVQRRIREPQVRRQIELILIALDAAGWQIPENLI